jgi:hypothetical protein
VKDPHRTEMAKKSGRENGKKLGEKMGKNAKKRGPRFRSEQKSRKLNTKEI